MLLSNLEATPKDSLEVFVATDVINNIPLNYCYPAKPCGGVDSECNISEECEEGLICSTNTAGFSSCQDLNECEETPDICGVGLVCMNIIGTYRCEVEMATVVIGGTYDGQFFQSSEVYGRDFQECLHNIPSLPRNFYLGGSVAFENKLYVCGGEYGPNMYTNTHVSCYKLDLSLSTPTWNPFNMGDSRSRFSMVVYERKIYIISGRYAEEGVEGVRTTTIAHDVDTQSKNIVQYAGAYPSADSVSLFEHCAVLDENYPGHPAILVLGGYAKNLGKLMKTVNVFNLNMHYWEQHINEMPAERSAFGCTIIRRAKDDKRMLVISGGHGGGVTDFSYWTFMDTNKYSWNILVSDSAAVSYAHILQLSSREFYLFESQSGPDAGYTNYWYYWQDNSIEGNENVIQKYQKNRQSPRQFFAVASIPRSSLILGNCVKPSP